MRLIVVWFVIVSFCIGGCWDLPDVIIYSNTDSEDEETDSYDEACDEDVDMPHCDTDENILYFCAGETWIPDYCDSFSFICVEEDDGASCVADTDSETDQ